ncbi:MAG: immunoglobulin domain-containing protein [Phycisphaerales bacterium]|nr:immunoglobulin domain-containing protein [Phycisphaerales bacterium]
MKSWAKSLFALAFPAAAGVVGYFGGQPVCMNDCAVPATAARAVVETKSDQMIDEIARRAVAAATPGFCAEEAFRRAGTALCFAPGTPPDVIEEFTRRMMLMEMEPDAEGGTAYELGSRWSGTQGSPRALTWSFMPNGVSIPGGAGEPTSGNTLFTTLDSQFANNGGRATWIAKFQACFDRWAAVTGLSYTRVTNGGNDWDDGAAWGTSGSPGLRGDVRIGMHSIDGGSGVLAWNQFPSQGGDMCLDSNETWDSGGGDYRFLRNTVMHEHGHGIGMEHSCPANGTKLMEPTLNTNFDGPMHDDIRGGQRHYGDANETNDSAATATDMGSISPGGTITNFGSITNPTVLNSSLLSIDGNGDLDWYTFTITAPLSIDVTVTPRGLSYDQSPQNANGSCASGNTNNSIDEANIDIELIDRNGVTVLATANAQPAGTAESIQNISLSVVDNYYVRVIETGSPTQTQMYVITLDASCAGPGITDQPDPLSVCSGESASFTVVASGTGLSYQWRLNSVNISGATSATYTDLNVQPADAGNYDCVVSNACGSTTSSAAALTVSESVNITTHPQPTTVCGGTAVTFTLVATGGAPITYQWQRNGVNISGATGTNYTVLSATPSNAGTYRCVVTNPCGTVNSNGALLTVIEEAFVFTPPTNQTACVGGSATFTVVAGGTNPTYQWRFNGVNISGATSASYTDNNVQPGDVGNYDVIVSNSCGTETSAPATLTLNTGVSISQHPQSQQVCEGQPVTFTVTAGGSPAPTYQWRRNTVNIGGATGSSYSIASTSAGDAGNYDVVVTNPCGSVTSNVAVLTIGGQGPQFTQHPQSVATCEGASVTFTVAVSGGSPTYQWRKNAANIPGATSSSYTLNNIATSDAGSYDCVATTSCGSSTSNAATLTVYQQADANCDGTVNNFDIDSFVLGLVEGEGVWSSQFSCDFLCALDVNGDGNVDNFDIDPFVICVLNGGCP